MRSRFIGSIEKNNTASRCEQAKYRARKQLLEGEQINSVVRAAEMRSSPVDGERTKGGVALDLGQEAFPPVGQTRL